MTAANAQSARQASQTSPPRGPGARGSATAEQRETDQRFAPAREVEAYLADYLRSRTMPEGLREAIEYALLGEGKRLRPILAIRACQAVGGSAELAMPAAAAVEAIHAFSLVHDDLPAIDDDELRRGRPTLHKHAGEAMAILAGDALMNLAFEILTQRVESFSTQGALVRELTAGTGAMIAGQVYDTLPQSDPDLSEHQRLERIHRHKTAALIKAACRMGAILGRARADQLEAVSEYAESIGLMFQVVDDLLDVTATSSQLGKTAGKDERQGKLTYPGLMGLDQTSQEVDRLQRQAHDAIDPLGDAAAPLHDLCQFMATRGR